MKLCKQRHLMFLPILFPALVLSMFLLPTFATSADWPSKSITVNINVNPGGFADTSARVVGSEMAKLLSVPLVMVNLPGGAGGMAAETTLRAPNDGYTWVGGGGTFKTLAVMGLHDSSPSDWHAIPNVGYFGAIAVREDSPFKKLPDLIEALKANPGKIAYGASMPSAAWRLFVEIIRKASGLQGRYVPYNGSTPSQTALLTGDVQFVLTGVGEQAELLKGKRIRALAVFHNEPYDLEGYGAIPAITDFLPELKTYLPFPAWTGFYLRADVPQSILRKIDDAYLKAIQTTTSQEYCRKFLCYTIGLAGEDAQTFFRKQASIESWLLYELGVAKRSPEEFKIPRP